MTKTRHSSQQLGSGNGLSGCAGGGNRMPRGNLVYSPNAYYLKSNRFLHESFAALSGSKPLIGAPGAMRKAPAAN
jgi:hypothetical protein